MLEEISAAVGFIVRLIERSENFNKEQLENFKTRLTQLLVERFENHWFPDHPCKGQGYRCIRLNGRNPRDATLERAAIGCGLKYKDLKLPVELTIWVDPNEVCCRFGEQQGSCCTLASFNDKENAAIISNDKENAAIISNDKENAAIISNDKENAAVISKPLEKTGTIGSKSQVTPLSTSNKYQGNMKKGSGNGGTHKQNKSGSRFNKRWGGHDRNLALHQPFQPWYSVIPHNWFPPCPPYLLRTPPGGKWGVHVPNDQYHWQGYNHHKSTMKI